MNRKRITVITISYNDLEGLRATVNSVLNQDFGDIQYIVIDGESDDGSKDFLNEKGDHIDYWVSEPDQGIYDAMNKGIDHAKGEYILFLNAGDCLFSTTTISEFIKENPTEDIVYGNTWCIKENGEEFFKEMPDQLLGFNMLERTLNHQSTFLKSSLFANSRYDLSYKMLADWAFYNMHLLKHKASYRHIPVTIARYDMSGFSSKLENKDIMRADRIKFYKEHIEELEPMLRKDFNDLKSRYHALDSWKWVKWGRSLGKLKRRIFG